MYSDSALRRAVRAAHVVCLLGAAACGRIDGNGGSSGSQSSSSSSGGPVNQDPVFKVTWDPPAGIGHAQPTLLRLDFKNPVRTWGFGERYAGTDRSQIDEIRKQAAAPCDPALESAYNAILANDTYPVDVGYVGSVRLDMVTSHGAPQEGSSFCYAVHTKGGAWKWNFTRVPVIVDSGTPRDNLGPPGSGHVEFDVKTANVDLLVFMLDRDSLLLTKVTYTAIPAAQ
jgi:hypothetical protein